MSIVNFFMDFLQAVAKTTSALRLNSADNQDTYICEIESGLFGVLDGLSGHDDGRIASRFVKLALIRRLRQLKGSVVDQGKLLQEFILDIDQGLAKYNWQNSLNTLTTLTLLRVVDKKKKAILLNVGDSRAYLYRGGEFEQLTVDDDILSLKENLKGDESVDLVEMSDSRKLQIRKKLANVQSPQDLDLEEVWVWGYRGTITNSIGKGVVNLDPLIIDLKSGDVLLLCTDGVHDNLTFDHIKRVIAEEFHNPELLLKELLNEAMTVAQSEVFRSKPDDMTAVVIKVK